MWPRRKKKRTRKAGILRRAMEERTTSKERHTEIGKKGAMTGRRNMTGEGAEDDFSEGIYGQYKNIRVTV